MNERFVVSDDYSFFPFNVGPPSLAIYDNCMKLIVITGVIFLTDG